MGTSQVLPSSWRSSELLDWFGGCIREICANLDVPVKPVSSRVDMGGGSKLDDFGRSDLQSSGKLLLYTSLIDLTTVPWEVPRPAAALVNISEPVFLLSLSILDAIVQALWIRKNGVRDFVHKKCTGHNIYFDGQFKLPLCHGMAVRAAKPPSQIESFAVSPS